MSDSPASASGNKRPPRRAPSKGRGRPGRYADSVVVREPALPTCSHVQVELQCLTPIHIGGGEEISPADLVVTGNDVRRIDTARLMRDLAGDEESLARFGASRFHVGELLADRGLSPEAYTRYAIAARSRWLPPRFGQPVHTFARGGQDQPYVPGSSIKGALVSGLLWLVRAETLDRESQQKPVETSTAAGEPEASGDAAESAEPAAPAWVPKRFDRLLRTRTRSPGPPGPNDDALMCELLGRGAESRITRAVAVPDCALTDRELGLYHVGLMHLRDPDRGGHTWSGYRGEHVEDVRYLAHHYLEALQPGTHLAFEIRFDQFLLDVAAAAGHGNPARFPEAAVAGKWCSPQFVLSGVGDLALHALWQEYTFFERTNHNSLAMQTRKLYERCRELPGNEVLIRFGWGIGWHGLTGLLWDEGTARELRLPARDKNAFPYPKTRRIVFDGDRPVGTPGWALLRLVGSREGVTA